ncbi:amidohydrolase family protein [Mucilaginibacter pedocola]|uniref:Amidohydrolase-related domain-containing protein n=1 Tax=Mucilaginibacter pedocola TaxID=1792845 RepID=A0A1S9P8J0_9SPHI|nr:amidohydrolase family protein [Mucilaginibacter pedocola]OOQ57271.1 hypothetical protein BC343_14235 [Mucilaginibacter pedocola]
MILNNVQLIDGSTASIRVSGSKIAEVSAVPMIDKSDPQIVFLNALAFPGLINSHDHLDFNLFPKLGHRVYKSYTEWGPYIHQEYPAEIASVLKIPAELRLQWGIYKNLLCGVTTVVNHVGPKVVAQSLINIVDNKQDLHSVGFEKQWRKKLNNPLRFRQPVVVHIGEGTNAEARAEANKLIRWNLLHRNLIGVHGVAMSPAQAKAFEALVWCPQSNYFLLNATAPIHHLKKYTHILFGTDSTLTADWDIWEHIRMARGTQMLNDNELYRALTTTAAEVWKLNSGEIAEGMDADIVIAKTNGKTRGMEAFYQVDPGRILLVIKGGEIKLFDQSLYHQLSDVPLSQFSKVYSGGAVKYVQGDINGLMNEIKRYRPDTPFPVYQPSEPAA